MNRLIRSGCIAAALSVQIATAQSVQVLEPNGGETFHFGDTMRIRWTGTGMTMAAVFLTVDGGEDWKQLYESGISEGSPNWGDTSWVVPSNMLFGAETTSTVSSICQIRICDYVSTWVEDTTDAYFEIADSAAITPTPDPDGPDDGCGSGAGSALLVPIAFGVARRMKKKQR